MPEMEIKKIIESESSYSKFIELIFNNPELLNDELIKTSCILKIVGRRPILYFKLLEVLNENEEMQLSDIYRFINKNFGETFENKIKAGPGLKPYLQDLNKIGLVECKKNGSRIKWLPSVNEYSLDISNKKYKIRENINIENTINSKLDIKLIIEGISNNEDFNPKKLVQSLIKSDVNFDDAILVLSNVITKLENDKSIIDNKQIKKNTLIEIIIEEMGECNIGFNSIEKFSRMVNASSPYGVFMLDKTNLEYIHINYKNLFPLIKRVIFDMITFEDISYQKIENILDKIIIIDNEKSGKNNEWEKKKLEYKYSKDKVNTEFTNKVAKVKINKDLSKNDKFIEIESLHEIKQNDLHEIGINFAKRLNTDELDMFKYYMVGKKELATIKENIFYTIKKMGLKYLDTLLIELIIKEYVFDRNIIPRKEIPKKILATREFDFGKAYLDLANKYYNNGDKGNSIYHALMSLEKFYSVLFISYNKIGGSSQFSAITKCSNEIFGDKIVVKNLKTFGLHDKYFATIDFIKKTDKSDSTKKLVNFTQVIQRDGLANLDIKNDVIDKLFLHTYKVKDSTQEFINKFQFEK